MKDLLFDLFDENVDIGLGLEVELVVVGRVGHQLELILNVLVSRSWG